MTKSFFIHAFILSLAALVSCSKDDDKPQNSTPAIDLAKCKLTSQSSGNMQQVITYGVNGGVQNIATYLIGDTALQDLVTYSVETDGSVLYVNLSGRERRTYRMDLNNKASSSTFVYYQGMDPTQATSALDLVYGYDASGKLVQVDITASSQAGSYSYTKLYNWVNGNMVREVEVNANGDSSITNYTYYTDKPNAFAVFEQLTSFTGSSSKNLPKTIIGSGNNRSYTYEFDASGKPVKTTITTLNGIDIINNTFDCS